MLLGRKTHTPSPKYSVPLDGEIVDPEMAEKIEIRNALKVRGTQSNHLQHLIIKCDIISDKIGRGKYPQKCFQLSCPPEGHIN